MGTDSPKMTCFRLKVQPLLERLLRAPRVGRVSGLCQHFFVFLREREILPLRVGRVFAIANVGGNCDGLLSREVAGGWQTDPITCILAFYEITEINDSGSRYLGAAWL